MKHNLSFFLPAQMTETCILPDFTDQQAADAANSLFGLSGSIKRLNGERDLNFLIDVQAGSVVFKISNQDEDTSMLECQNLVFEKIAESSGHVSTPRSVLSINGLVVESVKSAKGIEHYCRVVTFVEGQLLSTVFPRTSQLLESLGRATAEINVSMQGFNHSAIERPLLWNMINTMDVIDRFKPLIHDSAKLKLIENYQKEFRKKVLPISKDLRYGAIHNDINDNNVVVNNTDYWNHRVKGIIDFGDMVYSWIVVDVAVAAAYMMLNASKPLDVAASVIKGYHQSFPLNKLEMSILFELICARLCLSVCICAYQQSLDSNNAYLKISEQPAWEALERLQSLNADFVHFTFREACGLDPVPTSKRVSAWLSRHSNDFSSVVNHDLTTEQLFIMDTSVSSPDIPGPSESFDPSIVTRDLFRTIEDKGCIAGIGRYDEYRLLYSSDDFTDATGHRRTLHLGIDIFMPAGSIVSAPLPGLVHGVGNNDTPLDYGGTLILQHQVYDELGELIFYTLYGHLSPASLSHHEVGYAVEPGQEIAKMGQIHENGNWPPHLHFEIITDMLGNSDTFVGVGTHAHRNVWLSLCPDPNLILRIPDSTMPRKERDPTRLAERLSASRTASIGPSLSLSYRQPIHMARGGMQYLYDYAGFKYLDAVNNVPHVGHCHPVVVEAQRQQSRVLNTNTRYLYSNIEAYSERLLEKFPPPLSVCYFVNSGSEANDLALRIARNKTSRQDVITLDHAYHGNLSTLIDISPYKHNSAGGTGVPNHVHTVKMPDIYRGKFTHCSEAGADSIDSIKQALQQIERQTGESGPAAFISESILGCGGQIVLPDGYLKEAYALVRESGGLSIADEVQVGFGRVGSHFWAFQTQGVVPDIVTLGKPMGNGHPLAAVITTKELADSFNNGMEYFSTFGGNPVSCAIGNAVLEVIETEELQKNALDVGALLFSELDLLKEKHTLIGDVRGAGLFLGIELVNDHTTLTPAADQADYIAERMKQEGVLISTDGPLHNVLKIKPPICFNKDNVEQLVSTLSEILSEPCSQPVL